MLYLKEKLTSKEIAPYLPYSLKVTFEGDEHAHEVDSVSFNTVVLISPNDEYGTAFIENCRPILKPLSDLFVIQNVNGQKMKPILYLRKYNTYDPIGQFIEHIRDFEGKLHEASWECCPKWVMDKLLEWHFDIFFLIDSGLAVDINTFKK